MWTICIYFKPAYLFNEMLGHLVNDRFLVYELKKHRAHGKGAVLLLTTSWKPHVHAGTLMIKFDIADAILELWLGLEQLGDEFH
jgi:hypothetical protein